MVAVEDKGLPIDFSKPPEESTLGLSLMRGFAEEISFLNLGKAGRRIEFAASLPARPVEDYLTAAERAAPAEEPPLATDVPTLQLMTEDDAVALARCIYRAYGYTYVDFIYYPDRIAEMLRSGLMMSCVAKNDAGEIVGHLALLRGPEQQIAEFGNRGGGSALPRPFAVQDHEAVHGRGGAPSRPARPLQRGDDAASLHPEGQYRARRPRDRLHAGLCAARREHPQDRVGPAGRTRRAAAVLLSHCPRAASHAARAAASPRHPGGHLRSHRTRPPLRRSVRGDTGRRADAARRPGTPGARRRDHHGTRLRRRRRAAGASSPRRPVLPQDRYDLSRPAARRSGRPRGCAARAKRRASSSPA